LISENELLRLAGFYENELVNNILSFWLPRCEDKVYGGYFNCFDNKGTTLVSHDKYTWSQGRFVWLFARLAAMTVSVFSEEQKREFLRLAKSGRDFLMNHALLGEGDYRCVYLMAEDGTPKYVEENGPLDMSIYADCFVILGMARYAATTDDRESYAFGKLLYESVLERVRNNHFHTLPYPLSKQYRAHGIPMILSNATKEMYDAAMKLDVAYTHQLKQNMQEFLDDILTHFVDAEYTIHEVISADNMFIHGLLGRHVNPGHTIEDVWFMMEAADLLQRPELTDDISNIARRALEIGWDNVYGGIFHYCCTNGSEPVCTAEDRKTAVIRQVLDGWSDKLWWVHSEALYTTLLCYQKTGREEFWRWHEEVFHYTFRTFPNRDREIREWIQILKQDGTPQDKVVALPVKDPFHIARNLILILELLSDSVFPTLPIRNRT